MGDDLDEATFQARFEALREEYLAALPQRRAHVAEAWAACAHDADSTAWRELHTLVHRLSGSAPCYGLDDTGAAAHRIDVLLSGKSPCRDVSKLESLMADLLAALAAAA